MLKEIVRIVAAVLLLGAFFGLGYPLAMVGVGKLFFPGAANGNLVVSEKGQVLGSYLIAQEFSDPGYLWPRPSSGGYDGLNSGSSNLGLNSLDFYAEINRRQQKGLSKDNLFESASGLDPHLSLAGAMWQVRRIAKARGLNMGQVTTIIEKHTVKTLSSPAYVNVLLVNLDLDGIKYDY